MTTDVFIYGTPVVMPYMDGKSWRWANVGDLEVMIDIGGTTAHILVKDGFTTDLASIPKAAQWVFFMNPYEPYIVLAGLVHDWLSPTPAERLDLGNEFGQRPMFPPTISAGVFYELMKRTGVPMLRRRVYYYSVVAGIRKDLW